MSLWHDCGTDSEAWNQRVNHLLRMSTQMFGQFQSILLDSIHMGRAAVLLYAKP